MKVNLKIFSFFVLVSVLMMGGAIWGRVIRDRKESVPSENQIQEVQGSVDYSTYPALINIAPNNAFVGEQYRFDVQLVDSDTAISDLRVQLEEGPSWLKVQGLSLVGIPEYVNVGTSKVVLKVSDGTHDVFSTFYILVSKANESE